MYRPVSLPCSATRVSDPMGLGTTMCARRATAASGVIIAGSLAVLAVIMVGSLRVAVRRQLIDVVLASGPEVLDCVRAPGAPCGGTGDQRRGRDRQS